MLRVRRSLCWRVCISLVSCSTWLGSIARPAALRENGSCHGRLLLSWYISLHSYKPELWNGKQLLQRAHQPIEPWFYRRIGRTWWRGWICSVFHWHTQSYRAATDSKESLLAHSWGSPGPLQYFRWLWSSSTKVSARIYSPWSLCQTNSGTDQKGWTGSENWLHKPGSTPHPWPSRSTFYHLSLHWDPSKSAGSTLHYRHPSL